MIDFRRYSEKVKVTAFCFTGKKEPEHRRSKRMESIRLNKYLSDAGICSRRQADRWIEEKRITVNGEIAGMGMKVAPRGMPGWKTD